jgi:unsaturated rhamnogalacturonyl hydrolase
MRAFVISLVFGLASLQGAAAQGSPSRTMAETVIRQWPSGVVATTGHPGVWGYEEGVLLDGMAAEWHTTADGQDFAYIKAAVDKYVTADGAITGYKAEGQTLDDIELGRAAGVSGDQADEVLPGGEVSA